MDTLSSMEPRFGALALQILRLCVWLVLLAAIFTPLERLFAIHPRKILRPEILTDLGYYFLSSLLPSILLGVPLGIASWCANRLMPHAVTASITGWPLSLRLLVSLLIGEIGFYWGHRWSHQIPFLWRFHAVHHSAEHLDYLVSTRAHPVDMVFTRLCGLVPLYVLGLASPLRGSASLIPVVLVLVGTVWGFFIHANVRWRFGFLEHLIATPGFHHWHHTDDGPEFHNKNYAPFLPFVDTLFGTLHLPPDRAPQRYGISEPIPNSLTGQLIGPFLPVRKQEAGERVAAERQNLSR